MGKINPKIPEFGEEWEKDAYLLALKNALEHEGQASSKAVMRMLLGKHAELRAKANQITARIAEIVELVNSYPSHQLRGEAERMGVALEREEKTESQGLPPLPHAKKGRVVMRIAPFPSGPIHIGNARPFILNDEYVKMYDGKLLLVIDDTIGGGGKEIDPDAYDLIPAGLRWLGIEFHDTIYKSDRLEIYYDYAKKLIEKNMAYVCECKAEKLREYRRKGIECEHRSRNVEQNMRLFDDMVEGKFREGEASLRIKTDMKHKNPAFRDRVLMRISEKEHPRVAKKYKVWPLLEFSWAVDDHLLGITHILRGKDLMMETEMERYIWDIFGWEHVTIIHTGLMKIEGIALSKSKAQKEVRAGVYAGWDDPRTWSIQSLEKRGIRPEAVRRFVLSVGLSQADITVPIDMLYKENRRIVDAVALRYFFVPDPVVVEVIDAKPRLTKPHLHPDFPERGTRTIRFEGRVYIPLQDATLLKKGDVVRLKDLMNIRILKKKDTRTILAEEAEEKDVKKIQKIQWVPCEDNVNTRIVMPDASLKEGVAEPACAEIRADTIVQFERFGFCRIDRVDKVNKELVAYYTHR